MVAQQNLEVWMPQTKKPKIAWAILNLSYQIWYTFRALVGIHSSCSLPYINPPTHTHILLYLYIVHTLSKNFYHYRLY